MLLSCVGLLNLKFLMEVFKKRVTNIWYMLTQQRHIIGYDLLASSSCSTTNSRGLSHSLREFRHCAGETYQVGLMMASMLYSRCVLIEHTCHHQTYTQRLVMIINHLRMLRGLLA